MLRLRLPAVSPSNGVFCCVAKRDISRIYVDIHCKAQYAEEEEVGPLAVAAEMHFAGSGKLCKPDAHANSVVSLLKECANKKDLHRGSRLHADIVTKRLLEKDMFVGCTLINMYVKCSALSKAQEVFDELPSQNVASWNSLIAGYIQHGHWEKALQKFELMQQQGFSPDAFTFTLIVKACGSSRAAEKGQEIHTQVVRHGFLTKDNFVGTALIDMYAKCGLLGKAQDVFDQLPFRNVVSWTALIAGYAQQGHGQEALSCFEQMQLAGISPNAVTFVCVLKACSSTGDSNKGQELHAQIENDGLLAKNVILGTALVDMYSKCGLLQKAQEVFDQLSDCNVVTWNALIAGYAQHGLGGEALSCFDRMQRGGVAPNAITFICTLKACASIESAEKGEEIHNLLVRDGLLGKDIVLANALVDMYAKCGLLVKAQEVFNELTMRNVVSWNALIAGYVQHGLGEEALNCFELLQLESFSPDAVTLACTLKACGSIEGIDRGQQIHATVVGNGPLDKDPFIANALIDLYAKCGVLARAQEVCDGLAVRSLVSWTALVAGYAQHGHGEEALNCFDCMQQEGHSPDAVTFVCILRACGSIGVADEGFKIHAQIARDGLLERDTLVGTALIDMYAKCGILREAQEVFDELPVHDVVSWTVLIAGHAQCGYGKEAINSFEQMQRKGFFPDTVIFASILKACGSIGALDKGQELHAQIARDMLFERDVVMGTALVDMYAKCGRIADARDVFDELPIRNVVSWNALVTGYAQHANDEEALDCYECMQREGMSPDLVTFMCILKACGSAGATFKGQELHGEIVKKGLLQTDLMVGNVLIDMYANFCMLQETLYAFCNLTVRDVVSWNSLMAGYAQLGNTEIVLDFLRKMIKDDNDPDAVTFTIVLNTCSHGGLLDEGEMYFETMCTHYGIIPNLEHHTIMIDLFGRAGHLGRAGALIKKMPFFDNLIVWHTMLGACQKWENVEHGRWAFEHAIQLDEMDPAAYVSMSNINATGFWHDEAG